MRIFFCVLLLGTVIKSSAQHLTFQLLDAGSGDPIPFATVLTGPDSGTISNDEGYFTIRVEAISGPGIRISCMGYRTIELEPTALRSQSGPIRLEPTAINLDEVRLSNRIPTAGEIIARTRQRLRENYALESAAYRVFYRESETMAFERLDLELEKASDLNRRDLEAADARLRKLGEDIAHSDARKFLDFNGAFLSDGDTIPVLRLDRATELVDHRKDFSMDRIQARAQEIVLDHLDSSRTYKVKTGIFKIEDSISPGKEFLEEGPKKDSAELAGLKARLSNITRAASFREGTLLYRFLDGTLYTYEFLDATYFDGNYVYAVGFTPRRRKAKFAGTLFVDATSFAVLKADYQYGKNRRGDKVNLKLLLGIKFEEDTNRGTIIFRRDALNKYFAYYIQKEYGNYIYLHRSLKFIENSRSKKKVRFDFLMEGGVRQREVALLSPIGPLESPGLSDYQEPKKVQVLELQRYEPTIWEDTQIVEPLEAMKNFRVSGD